MDDRTHPPTRRLKHSIEAGEYDDAVACLRAFESSAANRKVAIREGADEIEAAADAPDPAQTCPHCGLSLPEPGTPACPGCGAPKRS